jgi:uncharacterized LabA/DUF88 family protein
MTRVVLYIDGFNLYFGLKDAGWRRYYWLNLELLARNLLKPDQQLVAVKYFTARISDNPRNSEKSKRQATYLEAVATLPVTTVFFGHYLTKPQKCRSCGATWMTHEEKMTDVNIAVELIADAVDDRFDTALLLSADSDLAAPVEFVRRRHPQKRIIVVCPPKRQSIKLESLVNATFRLGRKVLHDSQFPDEFPKPDGFVLKRPIKWQ